MEAGPSIQHDRLAEVVRALGLPGALPLTSSTMAAQLSVGFLPSSEAGPALVAFAERMRHALATCGVAIDPAGSPKALIAAGRCDDGALPVDRVSSLRETTLVGLFDEPCPVDPAEHGQRRLDRLVETLAWNIVQLAIWVDAEGWTLGTMNGAVERYRHDELEARVRDVLIPKLAAPVVPPRADDFEIGIALPIDTGLLEAFAEGSRAWSATGLLLGHTPLDRLRFRNRRYERIARAYLDHRSGMSYGFLAWQLPDPDLSGPIRMLSTRSGCDKSRIDVRRDLLLLELDDGKIRVAPVGAAGATLDRRPSYDTRTIVAHGWANRRVAELRPDSAIAANLKRRGLALAHWHGELAPERVAASFPIHGAARPPVSCSTAQSAIYAALGKIEAATSRDAPLEGDVHLEPLHGTNLSGPDLATLARHAEAWS